MLDASEHINFSGILTPMIKKLAFLLPGVIALVVAGAPMLAAHAQTPSTVAPKAGQRLNRLNLTDAQKAQLKQIRETTKSQVRAVLTTDQQAQLDAARQSGGKHRGVMKSLNLTSDQKAKIKAIMKASREQMQAVLTPAQQAQLQQMHRAHHNRQQKAS
jgi:Spy/CpxP family protein refolding chaperone